MSTGPSERSTKSPTSSRKNSKTAPPRSKRIKRASQRLDTRIFPIHRLHLLVLCILPILFHIRKAFRGIAGNGSVRVQWSGACLTFFVRYTEWIFGIPKAFSILTHIHQENLNAIIYLPSILPHHSHPSPVHRAPPSSSFNVVSVCN